MACRKIKAAVTGLHAIDAAIWDAGGTLFDTYPAVVSAAQVALASFGFELPTDRLTALFRRSTGYALSALAETFALDGEALTSRFRAAYDAVDASYQPPFPCVIEVCNVVRDAGKRNFIVTHRGRDSLAGLLEAYHMTALFADCITKEDPYPRKPDPASLLALMDRYGLEPQRCLVVGDRRIDIVAGEAAGTITCLFGDEDAAALLADHRIHDYAELLRWLDPTGSCTNVHWLQTTA